MLKNLVFLLIICFSAFSASAQEVEEDQKEEKKKDNQSIYLKKVTVLGAREDLKNLPGSATIVTQEELRSENIADINQALQRVPGVYVRQEDGYGLFPNISLRGVDPARSSKVTMMEDGILTAPAPYSAPSAYYAPNVARMSGLEILKGSSQIKYGPHTTGGVINYLSTPIPDGQNFYLKHGVGSFNETRTHMYFGDNIKSESGNFGYLIEYFTQNTDGFKKIDETEDFQDGTNTGFTRSEPMVKLSWESADDADFYQRLEFKYGSTDFDANETYTGLTDEDFEKDPYRRYAATRFDNIQTEHYRSYLRYFGQFTEELSLTSTVYQNYFHRDWYKLSGNGKTLTGDDLSVIKGEAAGTFKYRNNNRYYYLKGIQNNFEYATDSNILEFGVRYHEDRIRRYQRDTEFTQDAEGVITNADVGEWGEAGNRQQTSKATAIHLQDTIIIGDLKVRPGVRYEGINYTFEQKQDGDEVQREESRHLSYTTYGVGFTYDVDKNNTVFGGMYEGASPPSPDAYINGDLEEERSRSSEVGVRNLSKGYMHEIVAFYSEFTDLILEESVALGNDEPDNAGDITSQGIELMVQYDPATASDEGYKNPYTFSMTYTDARFTSDGSSTDTESIFSGAEEGNKVPYIPVIQASASAGLEMDNWGGILRVNYADETFTTGSNTEESVDTNGEEDLRFGKTDSYTLVNLSVYHQFKDGIRVFANVDNATDQKYIVSRHPIGARPGRPRTFLAGMEFNM